MCIYDKQQDEINLLHDYNINIDEWGINIKKYIMKVRIINEKNIEIYINNKKQNLIINIKVMKKEILKLNLYSKKY